MLTITRILVAEFSGRHALLPLSAWYQPHCFDGVIGSTHATLADAIDAVTPLLASLKDGERVDLFYHVAGYDGNTSLWPREYAPHHEGTLP